MELGYNGVEIVGQVFQKVNTELSEDKAIAVLGDIDSNELKPGTQTNTCMWMFIAAQFIIA